jgi:hypothetical protein
MRTVPPFFNVNDVSPEKQAKTEGVEVGAGVSPKVGALDGVVDGTSDCKHISGS